MHEGASLVLLQKCSTWVSFSRELQQYLNFFFFPFSELHLKAKEGKQSGKKKYWHSDSCHESLATPSQQVVTYRLKQPQQQQFYYALN